MNQQIVNYLDQNKNKYSKEQLTSALLNTGYQKNDIDEAINYIYPPTVEVVPQFQNQPNPAAQNQQGPVLVKEKKNVLPIVSKAGLFMGIGIVVISTLMIAWSFISRTSAKGDFIGTFSAQSDSENSMVAIEKALIKPGTYNINKSVQMAEGTISYKLEVTTAEVTDTNIKFNISITAISMPVGYAYLSSGSKDSKLFTLSGKEIPFYKDATLTSSASNPINYSAYFTKDKPTLTGYASFSQPTVPSDSFTFQFPDFPKIEGIVFK